jgi:hypothetical protein
MGLLRRDKGKFDKVIREGEIVQERDSEGY